MCGQKGRVCDYTLEELRKFRLLDCGEPIPTFKEALRAVDGKVPLIIEMKVEYFDLRICRAADRLLRNYKGVYCIESFNPLVLLWYRKNRPDVMRGQLSDGFIFQKEFRTPVKIAPGFFIQFLVTNCVTRPDFIAYNHKYQGNLSRSLVRRLFKGKAAAWTVRSEEELKRAKPHFDVFIFVQPDPHAAAGSFVAFCCFRNLSVQTVEKRCKGAQILILSVTAAIQNCGTYKQGGNE